MIEWPKKIYQKISKPSLAFCLENGITATQVTFFNHLMTLTAGCFLFSRGDRWGWIGGLGVCLINGFLDYLDGDLARKTKRQSEFGVWFDSGFDIVVQSAVMGSVALGCHKMGMPVIWIVLFFIASAANNFVSFNYNSRFGFDSDKGNEIFREFMDRKRNAVNALLKNVIDPTSSYPGLVTFTYRYFIVTGCLLNLMPVSFIAITIIGHFKWAVMYLIFALHLMGENRAHVFHALSILDEERNEFYRVRYCEQI